MVTIEAFEMWRQLQAIMEKRAELIATSFHPTADSITMEHETSGEVTIHYGVYRGWGDTDYELVTAPREWFICSDEEVVIQVKQRIEEERAAWKRQEAQQAERIALEKEQRERKQLAELKAKYEA